MKIIKILSLIFFSVLVSMSLLLLTELFLSVFTDKYDRLSDILRILRHDSVLFWKQKSNLNTVFQNQNLKTNSLGLRSHEIKDKTKKRIICMGASPTFGWGVKYEDTYPVVTEKILIKEGFDVETINAGQIGYSSYQGIKLFTNVILRLKPDIITVSYVINDVDKYRFFRSSLKRDSELGYISPALIFAGNILNKSRIAMLIRKIIVNDKSNKIKLYGEGCNEYKENRRVTREEYKKNLNLMLNIAAQNNIKVVFIVMPVNLPLKKALNQKEKEQLEVFINNLKSEIKNNKYTNAEISINKILKIDNHNPVAYYYMAVIAETNKDYKSAAKFFEISKNFEIFDCATMAKQYNEIMKQIAKERSVPICNSAKNFVEYKSEYLFVDPKFDSFHPNAKGHKLIAEKLALILNDMLPGVKNGNREK
jgi:lysophospholipase L1-like esterase